jgi:hypothetical protein
MPTIESVGSREAHTQSPMGSVTGHREGSQPSSGSGCKGSVSAEGSGSGSGSGSDPRSMVGSAGHSPPEELDQGAFGETQGQGQGQAPQLQSPVVYPFLYMGGGTDEGSISELGDSGHHSHSGHEPQGS